MNIALNRKSKLRPIVFTGVAALLLVLAGFKGYQVFKDSKSPLDIDDLTVAVSQEDLSIEIAASGRIEPIKSVNVSPKEPARLVKLLVEQGDRVTAGQTLAVMENEELAIQISQAQADLNESRASFNEGTANINAEIAQAETRVTQSKARLEQAQYRIPQDIKQTQIQINASQSRLRLAQERIKRNKYLLRQGAISQDAFDEIIDNYQNALSDIDELKQKLTQLENTSGSEIEQLRSEVREARISLEQKKATAPSEVNVMQANLAKTEAAFKQSTIKYEDSLVKAPFSGIVTQRYAVEGSFVAPSTSGSSSASASANSILALAQGLEVIAKVPELDVGQLEPGQTVRIIADAYPEQKFTGKIKRIAPEAVIEEDVTSFEVRVKLLTGENILRSKMNVDVTFLGKKLKNSLVVPTVAIFTENGQQGVMIPGANDKPIFQPVKIGLYLGERTQILEGVTTSQKVFIDLPKQNRRTNQ